MNAALRRRGALVLVPAGLATLAVAAILWSGRTPAAEATLVSPEPTPLPVITRLLPQSTTSHAFDASKYQAVPTDLAARGYVEQEYLVRGDARVYDWPAPGELKIIARARYVTRILVRRPKDASHFSGTVIVEPFNPSADVDLPIMWAESHDYFMEAGDAWVGVTIKPNTVDALKRFDSGRYSDLSFPLVRPFTEACRAAEAAYFADIQLPVPAPTLTGETGLAWDILSEVGALLKSKAQHNPLHRFPVERVYLTGQSQTAGYTRTYASAISPLARLPSGKPIYDGFLGSGHMAWQVPLNNCAAPLAAGDPRLITHALGVPDIEISAQSDLVTNASTRRPDSDASPDLFRHYEVAGASHVDTWELASFPDSSDLTRSGVGANVASTARCTPATPPISAFPVRYAFNGAWRNLERWVREATAPPRAAFVQMTRAKASGQTIVVDPFGNAIGGVRMPYVDVPTATWRGNRAGGGGCMLLGYSIPFGRERWHTLYASHSDYVRRVAADVERLRSQRWLTLADASEILKEAQAASIP
jgi:Alpha/beta hydrolase domain